VAATFYEVAIQPTAQMMTDWLCRQGEHGKIELEDTQTALALLCTMAAVVQPVLMQRSSLRRTVTPSPAE
jgi:hypothetical protein